MSDDRDEVGLLLHDGWLTVRVDDDEYSDLKLRMTIDDYNGYFEIDLPNCNGEAKRFFKQLAEKWPYLG